MEILNVVTFVIALVAVVLSALVLSKVNKLLIMLRTPVVKKSSELNLKPAAARHPVTARDMAVRGDRPQKDNRPQQKDPRQTKDPVAREAQQGVGVRRDRNNNGRINRNEQRRRDIPAQAEKPQTPITAANPTVQAVEPTLETPAPVAKTPVRCPLPPRIAPETVPAVPEVSTPVAESPAVAEAVAAVAPEKVRYGRRSIVKTAPELEEQ